jgi:ubiquinone/menaquinone biosynthesis C-methylase UbiE
MTRDKPQDNFHFKLMCLSFKLRDVLLPRRNVLKEVGIEEGFQVLDYGCGPGGYVAAAAKLVGTSGKVYALDIHPLAIEKVQKMATKRKLTNVETIHSDCKTGLPDSSVDVALLYDTFHDLGDPEAVLEELHRVLKPDGILSFTDHHMEEDEMLSKVAGGELFGLSRRGKKTYTFSKSEKAKGSELRCH